MTRRARGIGHGSSLNVPIGSPGWACGYPNTAELGNCVCGLYGYLHACGNSGGSVAQKDSGLHSPFSLGQAYLPSSYVCLLPKGDPNIIFWGEQMCVLEMDFSLSVLSLQSHNAHQEAWLLLGI